MTIGELWKALENYPDEMELHIGFVNGHNIDIEPFTIAEVTDLDNKMTIAFMVDDLAIINN